MRQVREGLAETINRNNDEKFSEALQELMSRDQNPTWYLPTDWEETGNIIKQKIDQMET